MLTLLLAAIGLVRARRKPAVVLFVLATATVFVATVRLPGDVSLFGLTRTLVPERWCDPRRRARRRAAAVPGVGRPGAVPRSAVGKRLARHALARGRAGAAVLRRAAQHLVRLREAADQARIARLAPVDRGCAAFFLVRKGAAYDYDLQDDAMWVALATGIPTVNRRSGATRRAGT